MSHPRDIAFHPSSPPSEGGADSYRYEDTPDTRLTTFSPLDSDFSNSSRLLNALSLSTGKNDGQSARFGGPTSNVHRSASNESLPSVIHHDEDPFTSTPEKCQAQSQTRTKLSATASAFRPISATPAPLVANGASSILATPKPLSRSLVKLAQSPITGMPVYDNNPLSSSFSHDLKLSRSVRITATTGAVTAEAVQGYFTVSMHPIDFSKHSLTLVWFVETPGNCWSVRALPRVLSPHGYSLPPLCQPQRRRDSPESRRDQAQGLEHRRPLCS